MFFFFMKKKFKIKMQVLYHTKFMPYYNSEKRHRYFNMMVYKH